MTAFAYNQPIVTLKPGIQVDGLKTGVYRFQLRVIDDAGNVSKPDIVEVVVDRPNIIVTTPDILLPGRFDTFRPG